MIITTWILKQRRLMEESRNMGHGNEQLMRIGISYSIISMKWLFLVHCLLLHHEPKVTLCYINGANYET